MCDHGGKRWSVPPGVFMKAEDNIGANVNEGYLFCGSPS